MRWLSTRVVRLIGVAACLLLLWLFQPWAPYPPIRKLSVFIPRVQADALRYFDDVLPHRVIAAASPGEPFPRREAPLDVFYEWDGERRSSEAFLESASVTGLFVLHDGAIAHERYRLDAAPEDRRAVFGLTEGVTLLLLGAAVQEGRIASLDDRIDAYAQRYATSPLGALSIATFLDEPSPGPFEDAAATGWAGGYFAVFVLGRNPDGVVIERTRGDEDAAEDESTSEADASAREAALLRLNEIAGARAQVLAAVVRGAYGVSLAEATEQVLWGPLGMQDPASWSQHVGGERGVAVGACCLNATVRDLARLGALLNEDGVWAGERVLPSGWADAVGVWRAPDSGGEIALQGAYGQYLWIDRRRDVVIAMTGADPDWRSRGVEAAAFLRAVAAAVVD